MKRRCFAETFLGADNVNLPLFDLPLIKQWLFTFIRVLLGVVYLLVCMILIKTYVEVPLYDKDGMLNGVYTDGIYTLLMIACLLLSYGLLAKKAWVLTLYWTCCGFWDILMMVGFGLRVGNFNENSNPVEVIVYLALFLGPIFVGLFLLRHRDQFT